jgi:hypothetical protein
MKSEWLRAHCRVLTATPATAPSAAAAPTRPRPRPRPRPHAPTRAHTARRLLRRGRPGARSWRSRRAHTGAMGDLAASLRQGAIPHGHSARPDCHGATHGHKDTWTWTWAWMGTTWTGMTWMGMDGHDMGGHGHGHMGGMHAPRPHGNNAHEASLAASVPGRPLSP